MAITKILTINDSGEKFAGKHLKRAIEYIIEPSKTQGERFVTGINCQPQEAFSQMIATKQKFDKTNKRQGYHIILSFEEEKLEPELAFEIVGKFVEEYLGLEYEAIYAIHDNTAHTHGHIIFNSVSFIDGRKYRYEKGDWAKKIQPITNRLCKEYGLSTIEIEMEGSKQAEHYKDWNDFRDGKFVWREMIQRDLDACVIQANSFEEFLNLLRQLGYEIKQNKHLAVKPLGMQRFCRCKSIGEEYTEEVLKKRIANTDKKDYDKCEIAEYDPIEHVRLCGLQKTYYEKVCQIRTLQKLPYSKAWKHRKEIRQMEECHAEYLFLVKNDIHSLEELVAVSSNLEQKRKECQEERNELYREKKRYTEVFVITEKMEELLPAYHSYCNGDLFFEEEYEAYLTLERQLKAEGLTKEEVERIKRRCTDKLAGNYERKKAVGDNFKIAQRMLREVTKRMQEQEILRELKQIKETDKTERQPK